ncbi:MAG: DUF4349 domain-containing protein [Terriglobia bacterium]
MNRSLHSAHSVDPEELMAYLDGELPVERARECAAHLEQCRECQALTADLKSLYQQMNAWQVGAAPESVDRAVRSALVAERQQGREAKGALKPFIPLWRMPQFWAIAGAAMVLLLIGLGRSYLFHTGYGLALRPSASQPHLDTYARIYKPPAVSQEKAVEEFESRAVRVPTQQEALRLQQTENAPTGALPSGPMIARRASVSLITKDFDLSRAELDAIQHRRGGYAAGLQVEAPAGAGRTLTASLRIPADQLDSTLAEVKKLGRVEHESQSGEEVTEQYVDLNARLSNSRNTEQRLVEVLNQRTGKMADILAVENEIARVRGEIEQMEAERKNIEHRVAYAELQVELKEEYKAALNVTPPSGAAQVRNSLVEGLGTAADSLVGFAQLVLSCGPTLLLWALILFWPARILWRRWRAAQQKN